MLQANRPIYHLIIHLTSNLSGPTPRGNGKTQVFTEQADMSQFICELRSRTGLTQEQFAARLGVTFPTINRWENGRARPSPLAMRQVLALLEHLGQEGGDLRETYFAKSK